MSCWLRKKCPELQSGASTIPLRAAEKPESIKSMFPIIPKDDPPQALRVRRNLLAIAMAGIHLMVCCAMYYQGLFRLSFLKFVVLFAALWLGHFSFYTIIRTGFNQRFSDPSLTFVQILWTATCVMLTAYFLNGLRPVVLMLFLVGMLFGFMRLDFRAFIFLCLYADILYGVVIGLLCELHPEAINAKNEIIVWFAFSLIMFCFALMGREISHIRERLHARNIRLRGEITERKKVQEALRFRTAYFEGLVDRMPDAIAIFNDKGVVTEVNARFIGMFGYLEEEALGRDISELVGPRHRLEEAMAFRRRVASGETLNVETVRRKKDGSRIEVSLRSAQVVVENARVGNFVIYRDISARKQAEHEKTRLESQLQQSRKMEAIATLAGGIAHKFNNAMTPIIGRIELLQMKYDEDEETVASLKDMKASGHHVAHLTRQLLAYAEGGRYHSQTVSLGEFVRGVLPLIKPTLNSGVRLDTDLSAITMDVDIDPTQMRMVLSAVISNANDAIEETGCIRISVRGVQLDEAFVKAHPGLKPGPYVFLTIKDDGNGMDEETKTRIFEPFFTTHFIGRGLGMAAVYGIVNNHGGSITVDSELGSGTEVRIFLPAVSVGERNLTPGTTDESEVAPAMGQGGILVIEDEKSVMALTRTMLERLGYGVFEARTGKEALEIVRDLHEKIDLALLDIKLPDMTGNQLYPLLMAGRPEMKVLVCSGYPLDGPVQELLNAGAEGFARKPFSISTLSLKLKELVGNSDVKE